MSNNNIIEMARPTSSTYIPRIKKPDNECKMITVLTRKYAEQRHQWYLKNAERIRV